MHYAFQQCLIAHAQRLGAFVQGLHVFRRHADMHRGARPGFFRRGFTLQHVKRMLRNGAMAFVFFWRQDRHHRAVLKPLEQRLTLGALLWGHEGINFLIRHFVDGFLYGRTRGYVVP